MRSPDPEFTAPTSRQPPGFTSIGTGPQERLRTLAADLCAQQNFLVELFEVQRCELRMRDEPLALNLVNRSLAVAEGNVAELRSLLPRLAVDGRHLHASASALTSLFLGFIGKGRPRDLPGILQGDFTLLSMTTVNYSLLRSSALTLRDLGTAGLALTHLRQVIPLMRRITRLMPAIVARSLTMDFPGGDPAAGDAIEAASFPSWTGHIQQA